MSEPTGGERSAWGAPDATRPDRQRAGAPPVAPPVPPPPGAVPGAPPYPTGPIRIKLPPGVPVPVPPGPDPAISRTPSGLFPSGPPRPTYREPHPARTGAIWLGLAAGGLWMLLLSLLATTARGYAWWSIVSGAVAWGASVVLARFGDRGVAVGVALAGGVAVAITGIVVIAHWAGGHWLLW